MVDGELLSSLSLSAYKCFSARLPYYLPADTFAMENGEFWEIHVFGIPSEIHEPAPALSTCPGLHPQGISPA